MSNLPSSNNSTDYFAARVKTAGIIILCLMMVLAAKLWILQMVQGQSYVEMSYHNRIRFIRLPPSRGRIFDGKGHVLAENHPSFTFSIMPGELENPQEVICGLSPILGLTEEKMRGLVERSRTIPKFLNYPIKKNMSFEEVSLLKSRGAETRGVILEAKAVRVYPFHETLCHALGTLGEISAEELAKSSRFGYRTGDLIGKSGIEKEYETYLKGEEGWEQVEIDAKGRQLSSVASRQPKTGADVTLTIDADFQHYAEEVFIHRAGSVVAVDPDTGRILALVSKPGFDLNLFSPTITERHWKTLTTDALHPLENRAIRGLYSPASTFKMVTASAGLGERLITPDHKFVCKGDLELRGQIFRCWNAYGHGSVALHRAIVESCDIYFYQLGLKLGPDRIAKYATLFGLGTPTGLGLPQELPGLIPTPSWKLRTYGDHWKEGESVTFAIGQGYLVSTPIQLAMMTAALANGGKLLKPSLVQKIVGSDGSLIFEHAPILRWDIPLDGAHRDQLEHAMTDVVMDKKGTGAKCRIPGIHIKAKTGTSQVIRVKQRTREGDQIPYHERTHAIFIAYVNDRPKKIALAVIVEHGGGGGSSAGPIARKIIAKYYGVPDPGDAESDRPLAD
ncbi:MAG TPA: penicillin-binding protein 2 [Desulfomonilaceae bacterium]|nr:penicillin-binding protein 2 [Desulfomonilaceae bacterium]